MKTKTKTMSIFCMLLIAFTISLSGCVPSVENTSSGASSSQSAVDGFDASSEESYSLVGTQWALSKVMSNGVELHSSKYEKILREVSLTFDTDSNCTFKAAGHTVSRGYTLDGNQITIGDRGFTGTWEEEVINLQYMGISVVLTRA